MAPRTPMSPVTRSSHSTKRGRTSRLQAPSIQHPEHVLRRYLLWHEAEGHSRKTERNYRVVLGLFFTYLQNEHHIEDLNEVEVEHVRAWLIYLRNMPTERDEMRSSKTVENYARHLLAFLHWCVAEGVIDHNPTERVRVPKAEKKHIRVFNDDEVRALHEACIPPSTGLRLDVRRMLTARNRAILWTLLDIRNVYQSRVGSNRLVSRRPERSAHERREHRVPHTTRQRRRARGHPA